MRHVVWSILLVASGACGGGSSAPDATPGTADARPVDAMYPDPAGTVSPDLRIDHVGWRAADVKHAIVVDHPGAQLEVRRASDGAAVATITAVAGGTDEDSGDAVAIADFSSVTAPGDYYLYLPAANVRSYLFTIGDDVFDIIGAVAMKSFYYQRCNHDKATPFATDALGQFAGRGAQWVDGACHASDSAAPAGPGSADDGVLDLHGGWHDAGDYQKTLWGRGVPEILFAYEVNPGAWTDGQLHIPESGNGVPDLLDEVRWELDFYVRMQRPDGHFLSSIKGHDGTKTSPPSQSDEMRVYFDTTSPDGNGWSGGGVTLAEATADATMSLAHAAIVFAPIDAPTSATYRAAATKGWTWLVAQPAGDDAQRRRVIAAAAAVYRMDPSIASAKTAVEAFKWATWDDLRGGGATPGESQITIAAWHVLATPGAKASVVTAIKDAVADVIVGGAFSEAGAYGGMFGGPGNGWDWSWGSNRSQSYYGANLMMAVKYGATGTHSAADTTELAERHLHFMLGANPLNMVYLTNVDAYGAEHSSFQLYHGWFSYAPGTADGDHGNPMYNGKPAGVDEPLYPYYADDTATSTYGPAPGLVPGGPNFYYSAQYTIPNRNFPAYAYRDFSVGCDWDGANCKASSWEITEPMAAYQGPFVFLVSFFMKGS
ncbi:MAG TPA: glycoside hydrolase family 9 protein [Kofleriaceae bacterium]|nr:glycoside hydrolase family 9 protein [Kofleriaceae bacterium]